MGQPSPPPRNPQIRAELCWGALRVDIHHFDAFAGEAYRLVGSRGVHRQSEFQRELPASMRD